MKDPYHIWKTAIGTTRWIGSPTSVVFHTFVFVAFFVAAAEEWIDYDNMLLFLTTIVSLEAIYLAIFIQMTINYTTQELAEVSEDIEEMQEDIGEIQEDVGELQEDIEEISEDVEEMSEEEATEEQEEEARKSEQKKTLTDIQADLRKLMQDISRLQQTTPKEDLPPKTG
ncbi:hypothetical protein A2853_00110 [Candidatus Kaiserbacteria bacterium RIFCSPHIGHO2_01_FULL_55_17]|uniref:DUF1003 domain-containing protein n=1 Tax=Candidatus Kaiserbacteria bacterium RIFCSPHIGHO2_01_FULL_55_17 TaxID=1798484 RepID=A0A1F6DBA2_9BACT|nr:MAG: hypothetical protein A2853_00110 [Candidatus Kaiserbacteria bacterium RIFCSPHIGHO2_01_FULL_55_17]